MAPRPSMLLAMGLAAASVLDLAKAFMTPLGTSGGSSLTQQRQQDLHLKRSSINQVRLLATEEAAGDAGGEGGPAGAASAPVLDATEKTDVTGTPLERALAAKDRVDLGGVQVSPLGIGAWAWGDTMFWGYSEAMDKELQEVFGNCVRDGVNLFDTAEVYGFGRSEYLCGKFRRDYKGVDKDGIVIASKFAPLPWRLGRQSVVNACKASLDRMGAESMEVYQIHWPFGALSPRFWDGLADCVEQGLVKSGVSKLERRFLASEEPGRSDNSGLARSGLLESVELYS